jgi:hypothetical protein
MTNKDTGNITAEADTVPRATPGDMCDPIAVATPGRIAKFATATTLTDSIITENAAGRIGVGTAPATAILTVTSAAAASPAIRAETTVANGFGVLGVSSGGDAAVVGISDDDIGVGGISDDDIGVGGQSITDTGVLGLSSEGAGVEGFSNRGTGVVGVSDDDIGVAGDSITDTGVWGHASNGIGVRGTTDGSGIGVAGQNPNGTAIAGFSAIGIGVQGGSVSGPGLSGFSSTGPGLSGFSSTGPGVLGRTSQGFAGVFEGRVHVSGFLTKGGGGFEIDHPLDPENKYLYHSFVESPDMLNVYNGNVTTDATGEARVTLPAYFEALNQDFRYQLTVIGQFAQAIVAQEIRHNQFTIKTDQPGVKVSWQVTGIRQDPWAVAHRMAAEEEKAAEDKGRYVHPELWGQPEEARVHWSPSQIDRLEEPPRIDRLEEPPRIDRARLEKKSQQMKELVQRIRQEVP